MSDNVTLYCTFLSAGRLFGVPVLDVKEVTAETRFTRIPHAPEEVLGLVNIRGHIFLALNLATHAGGARSHNSHGFAVRDFQADRRPCVRHRRRSDRRHRLGLGSARRKPCRTASRCRSISATDRRLISTVCKLDDQLLIILDPRRFLACVEHSMGGVTNV